MNKKNNKKKNALQRILALGTDLNANLQSSLAHLWNPDDRWTVHEPLNAAACMYRL